MCAKDFKFSMKNEIMNQKNLKILTNWENQTFFVKKLLKTWKNDEKGENIFSIFFIFLV